MNEVQMSEPEAASRMEGSVTPSSCFKNVPLTVSGKLFGSWKGIVVDGYVPNKPVRIVCSWGYMVTVTTGSAGMFSATFNSPASGGAKTIDLIFDGDSDIAGCSKQLSLTVLTTVETSLSLGCRADQSGMGSATRFFGYLREKGSGVGIANKQIKFTVLSGGSAWTHTLTTNSQGYYDYLHTGNGGIFSWAEARFNGDSLYLASYSGRIYGR
jgi:hypothetical protein